VTRALMAAALSALALPLLVACGAHPPSALTPGNRRIDVSSPDLVAYKLRTDIPDCPKVAADPVPGGMPSVTVPCLGGGRAVDVAGLRGPMIVNFWASWCGDCVKEMPALAAFAKGQSTVKVVGIDVLDTGPGAALQLAGRSHVGYPLLADPDGTLDHASPLPVIPGLPFTAFVDATGRLVHYQTGAMKTEADVAAAARKYLGAPG
jgi:thiol-disulfide isomerase/thioredoxin